MRILAVSHACVTDVNQQFYAELENQGHEVELIIPSNFRTEYRRNAEVQRWQSFKGAIHARRVLAPGSIPLHFYQAGLRSVLSQFSPDVLYVEEEPYSISAWQAFRASRGFNLKRVVYSAQNICKRYPLPIRLMERYVLSQSRFAAVVSEEVTSVLRLKGYSGEIIPFPLGVDTRQFSVSEETKREMRQRFHLKDYFVIGYVGRFVEEKGIRTVIDAVPTLRDIPVKFVFVGDGPLLSELQRTQEHYPESILVHGYVPHKETQLWMNAFDVLLLPSISQQNWREQFGRVVVEAMACGTPVIGSTCGEIPTLISSLGGGWIFPESDVSKLSAVIRHAFNHPDERMAKSAAGHMKVNERYSKRTLATSFLNALF